MIYNMLLYMLQSLGMKRGQVWLFSTVAKVILTIVFIAVAIGVIMYFLNMRIEPTPT